MSCKLILKYEFGRDGDDFGWLAAEVDTPSFKGVNGAWVQWQDIPDYADSLRAYPIAPDAPVICAWGFGERGASTDIISIRIAPTGVTGGLEVDVSLANWYEPTNNCRVQFETDYPSISRFREQIERMMEAREGDAVLYGSTWVR